MCSSWFGVFGGGESTGFATSKLREVVSVKKIKESCFVDMSSSSGNFSGSCVHMCNEQTCVLRTSLSLYNFGRRFLGCSRYKVGPKCPFFVWLDNLTCPRGNEIAPLALERMSRLQITLQLANKRERTALKTAEKARKMAEKALEEEAKAKERGRKA
ncbi:hypothetical protein SO802_016448 [Lithocarpus litseifolius]|uniref:GRF-type domain-containing protein n=1 Tax=Lithocarpus litseifolius TaxID=425828 RepID=A0AAW2CX65_9ROSI